MNNKTKQTSLDGHMQFIDSSIFLLQEYYANKSGDFDRPILISLHKLKHIITSLFSSQFFDTRLATRIIRKGFLAVQSHYRLFFVNGIIPEEDFDEFIRMFRRSTRVVISELRKLEYEKRQVYNSKEFYEEKIEKLEEKTKSLSEYLKDEMSQKDKENALNIQVIREKEITLKNTEKEISLVKAELEEKKKNDDVIVEWKGKIKSTFETLNECIKPIKTEHRRLEDLFLMYGILIAIVVVALVTLEGTVLFDLNKQVELHGWKYYIVSVVPIPILGSFLWTLIIQLNKTQRQLVLLAKHMHEVGYIEGLLLSVNSLSLDIKDSSKRVNSAIDKLLENHLNNISSAEALKEENIITEESKDVVPLDEILKLVKEIKGIVGK